MDVNTTIIYGIGSFMISTLVSGAIRELKNDSRTTEIQGHISKISDSLNEASGVIAVDYDELITKYLSSKMKGVETVHNTFIPFQRDASSQESDEKNIIKLYKTFFENKGKKWVDVMDIASFFGDRLTKISKTINPKSRNLNNKPRHIIHFSKHKFPIINFLVINHEKDDQELFFGWLYRGKSEGRKIYRTSDKGLITLFMNYFEFLKDYKHHEPLTIEGNDLKANDEALKQSEIVDREGQWLTIATREIEPKTKQSTKFVSIGFLNIAFKENNLKIDSDIIWQRMDQTDSNRELYSHQPENCSYTEDKIFIRFGPARSRESGLCYYEFMKYDDNSVFEGHMHSDSGAVRGQLFGIRLDYIEVELQNIYDKIPNKVKVLIDYADLGTSANEKIEELLKSK